MSKLSIRLKALATIALVSCACCALLSCDVGSQSSDRSVDSMVGSSGDKLSTQATPALSDNAGNNSSRRAPEQLRPRALVAGEPLVKTDDTVDAARLLAQASYGASHKSLIDISTYPSLEAWIDQQMLLPATLQLPAVQEFGNASFRPARHYVWWDSVVNAEDQLRQRVAFAMSEIFVVSDIDYTLGNAQHGIVHYYDMLATNAFGNFRELLEQIALHPVMGIYLSMVRNEKADAERNIRPDENFAREIMQLFTIGLYELDEGGTPVPVGNPAPAYTQADVEEYARVFTGWNFSDSPEWQSTNLTSYDKINPMVPQKQFHDSGRKKLLGGVIAPAGLSVREDLELALDSLFNHKNVGPFIARAFIQRMVSSNPSKAYVARIAAVFNNNGKGERGDLGAVIKAMLLDPEARQFTSKTGGKFKEPVLRATHMLRALNAVPGVNSNGHFHMYSKTGDSVEDIFGQSVLSSPSVFNFFSPGFSSSIAFPANPAQALLAPELQILNESLVSSANNDLHSMIYSAHNRSDSKTRSSMINIDAPIAMLRKGRDTYLEHMNLLLMSGTMSADMQALLADYINESVNGKGSSTSATDKNSAEYIDQQLALIDENRIQTMVLDSLFMMLASPEFMIQR